MAGEGLTSKTYEHLRECMVRLKQAMRTLEELAGAAATAARFETDVLSSARVEYDHKGSVGFIEGLLSGKGKAAIQQDLEAARDRENRICNYVVELRTFFETQYEKIRAEMQLAAIEVSEACIRAGVLSNDEYVAMCTPSPELVELVMQRTGCNKVQALKFVSLCRVGKGIADH